MSDDLLAKLDEKVKNAIETIELLKLEVAELREEREQLSNERDQWKQQLLAIVSKFDVIESGDLEQAKQTLANEQKNTETYSFAES
jgi:cell division protein ZapB